MQADAALSRLFANCTPLTDVPPWRRQLGRALGVLTALAAAAWLLFHLPMMLVGAAACGPIVGAALLADWLFEVRPGRRSGVRLT
ncbi:MAG: hypothetical protein F4Z82_15960 [Caldilineaceae bacterium SB0668_bin_21]|nr:hypothetical protein [Caldilineaceae bacterium SB0668_bin_21]